MIIEKTSFLMKGDSIGTVCLFFILLTKQAFLTDEIKEELSKDEMARSEKVQRLIESAIQVC